MEHKCDREWVISQLSGSRLNGSKDHITCGEAITSVIRVNGKWFAYNDEYATEIRYCPFCGLDLKLLDWEEEEFDAKNNVGMAIGIVDKDL
jgi:hypothetical protein